MTFQAGRREPVASEERKAANRLLMVSNRGPVEHVVDATGRVVSRPTDGGVATALTAIAECADVDWIACAGTEADAALARRGQRIRLGGGSRLAFVAPPAEAYELFYNSFCNPVLWFLQHGLWEQLETSNTGSKMLQAWQLGYLPVNQSMAEMVAEALRGRIDRVMFHDYHFYMAPLFVRNYHARAWLQQFVHIPWPGPEEWLRLPRRVAESICRGLLANDSVVFQTADSVDNFIATCEELLADISVDFDDGLVETRERLTRVWANPISIDVIDLHKRLLSPEAEGLGARLLPELGRQTIVRVDRLDPSKNILGGFEAFEMLLERHPELRGEVRFLAFLVPSRETIAEYSSYTSRVLATVEGINQRFGTCGWQPLKVYHEHNRLQALEAMRFYDVLLVNSLADGMNLVSKEGPALNERDGVLVLSKTAGSYAELSPAALGIDAGDIEGTAEAMHRALTMPAAEREARARHLRAAVAEYQLSDWLGRQLEDAGIEQTANASVFVPLGAFSRAATMVS